MDRIGACGASDTGSTPVGRTRMTIAICGSLTFHTDMRRVQETLTNLGHKAIVPKSLSLIEHEGFRKPKTVSERLKAEAKYDFIREHFRAIESSDAILVVNSAHHGISGYIGGNTFLEMGIAFYLRKTIYLLNPVPSMDYELELAAMHPVVLNGDLARM